MNEKVNAASAWPWIPVIAAILGVTLGWILSRIPARRERRSRAAGYFRGIDAEIDHAVKHARIYAEGENGSRIIAPAYRLLTQFSADGTTWLSGEGFITRAEMESLLAFLAGAEEFNRSLEQCAALAAPLFRPGDSLDQVYFENSDAVQRTTVKAINLYRSGPTPGTAIKAQAAIRAAAARAGLPLA